MQINLNNNQIISSAITGCIDKNTGFNTTGQRADVVVNAHSDKKTEHALLDITEKISGYGKDITFLILIVIIPLIPFWQ